MHLFCKENFGIKRVKCRKINNVVMRTVVRVCCTAVSNKCLNESTEVFMDIKRKLTLI